MKHKHSLLKQQLVAAVVRFYINSQICEKLLHIALCCGLYALPWAIRVMSSSPLLVGKLVF